MAYLTDSEQTTNTFTIGKVKIDVQDRVGIQPIKNNNNIPDKPRMLFRIRNWQRTR